MITAEEAKELQNKNQSTIKDQKINTELSNIECLIREQSYYKDNFIYYSFSTEGFWEDIIAELIKLKYTCTEETPSDVTVFKKYKISW